MFKFHYILYIISDINIYIYNIIYKILTNIISQLD